jgi:small neutral amino acid transporter SnatA (MarC family)
METLSAALLLFLIMDPVGNIPVFLPLLKDLPARLFGATTLYRILGARVISALERLMGMLLVALSVQMFLDGLASYLNRAAVSG